MIFSWGKIQPERMFIYLSFLFSNQTNGQFKLVYQASVGADFILLDFSNPNLNLHGYIFCFWVNPIMGSIFKSFF